MNQPILTLRQDTTPYNTVASPLPYSETIATQSGLPIVAGDNSDTQIFRLFNNFLLASNIANAVNVVILTADDNSGSLNATKSVVFQDWLNIYETGIGEGNSAPGSLYSLYNNQPTAIGLNSTYSLPTGTDQSVNSIIRAGASNNGCGFVQLKSYLAVPLAAGMASWTFALVVQYDWST